MAVTNSNSANVSNSSNSGTSIAGSGTADSVDIGDMDMTSQVASLKQMYELQVKEERELLPWEAKSNNFKKYSDFLEAIVRNLS